MKKSIIAVLLAILMLLPLAMVAGKAITVEKDGREYLLRSPTPTVGDVNVLMIRLGFADYPADDEDSPADSEATLLSYFDGTADSVNGFYETSSYGKLRLHCDKVYTYNALRDRYEYTSSYTVNDLLAEVLTALDDEIDYGDYDSDGDGFLDVVCFDYAGPMGNWNDVWWPHVSYNGNVEIEGKKLSVYSLLRGQSETFKHEFGHVFGAADYYSYGEAHHDTLMTFDMMSVNTGDHNGFTKWIYGWLGEEDIAFIDRASGGATVELAPIETPMGDGKKIAVIAPSFNSETRFLDEFFLVEYDSGEGNNKSAFDEYGLTSGFRIFHVNAKAYYNDEELTAAFMQSNDAFGINLIHNTKNELDDPLFWSMSEMFFREGDSLTFEGDPNTGLSTDTIYNGSFSGVSITDFVTGDHPSFKVGFSDEKPLLPEPNITLKSDSLSSQIKMTLVSDRSLVQKERGAQVYEDPYLLASNGTKLTLSVRPVSWSFNRFELRYSKAVPAVEPDTEYTLVIPKGYFLYGYSQEVPEFREQIKTESFLPKTEIERYISETGKRYSNIFSVTDDTYGRIEMNADTKKCAFIESNLNGEEIARYIFTAPVTYPSPKYLVGCSAYRLLDGTYALSVNTIDSVFYVKFDRYGKLISDVFTIAGDRLSKYLSNTSKIDPKPFKDGLIMQMHTSDYQEEVVLTVDFVNEPTLSDAENKTYIALDRDHYIIKEYRDDNVHLGIYDRSDRQTADIIMNDRFTYLGAFIRDNKITVLSSSRERGTDGRGYIKLVRDEYSESGELLQSEDISEQSGDLKNYYKFDRVIPTGSGYYVMVNNEFEEKVEVIVCDLSWNKLGGFSFSPYDGLEFLGECGLNTSYQYFAEEGDSAYIISRFHIGDFKIVPKRDRLGDANLDGAVDITDATTVQRYDVLMTELNETALWLADVDRNGQADIMDATWLQRFEVGLKAPIGIGKPIAI